MCIVQGCGWAMAGAILDGLSVSQRSVILDVESFSTGKQAQEFRCNCLHLECIGCCVVVAENHQALCQPRDSVLRELLVDEVAGEGLDRLEGQVDGVDDDAVLGETHLELEGDLGPSSPALRHLCALLQPPPEKCSVSTCADL